MGRPVTVWLDWPRTSPRRPIGPFLNGNGAEWSGILAHDGMTRGIHMRDLYGRRDEFAGKDHTQAQNAAADVVAYLEGLNEWRFRRYSCVVRAADYERARLNSARLKDKTVHAFGVNTTLSSSQWGIPLEADY